MRQTLYLDGRREALGVELHGSALKIARPSAAPSFAPLERTRRICCWGRVQWAGEALIACALGAIPISFLAHGRSLACVLPNRPPPRSFAALVEDAALNPAWGERLENWVESEAARAVALVMDRGADRSAAIRAALDYRGARQTLNAVARIGDDGGAPRRIWLQLQEYLHAWAIARLQAEDIPSTCFGYSSAMPNLPECVARALSPLLLPALAEQSAREVRRQKRGGRIDAFGEGGLAHRCALAFDQAEPALAARMRCILRGFERLVRDCAEEVDSCRGF